MDTVGIRQAKACPLKVLAMLCDCASPVRKFVYTQIIGRAGTVGGCRGRVWPSPRVLLGPEYLPAPQPCGAVPWPGREEVRGQQDHGSDQ